VKAEATERPAYQPTVVEEPSALTFEVPEEGETPPPESSGDGLSAPTPKQPPKPRQKTPAEQDAERVAAAQAAAAAEAAAQEEQRRLQQAQAPSFQVPAEVVETYESRRAVQFHVRPDVAMVTINGVKIGKADDWDGFGGGKTYSFPREGDYYAELTADGFQSAWVKISILPTAKELTAKVRTKLQKNQ
jgi:hypothetical protein